MAAQQKVNTLSNETFYQIMQDLLKHLNAEYNSLVQKLCVY